MGLDMYLYLKKDEFVGIFDSDAEKKMKDFYPEELEDFARNIAERNFMGKSTKYQIGYWRKANAIHNWFVQECAGGVDECQDIYVSEKKLKSLLDLCDKVLEDPSQAESLLPTTTGFFFGSQEYDKWYFDDIKYTKELITKIIDFIEKEAKSKAYWDVIYSASW